MKEKKYKIETMAYQEATVPAGRQTWKCNICDFASGESTKLGLLSFFLAGYFLIFYFKIVQHNIWIIL